MQYEIESLNDQGKGICFINNKITFVDNTIPGDIVEVEIIKETSKYNIGKVLSYISNSSNKVESYCPYYNKCGGCSLSCISYEKTLEFKKNKVEKVLKKFANIYTSINIVPSDNKLYYRNKITLKVINSKIGYYEERTNNIIEIDKCNIANDEINKYIKYIKNSQIINGKVVIRCNYNNELLVNYITDDPIILPIIKDLKIVGILNILFAYTIQLLSRVIKVQSF